eukprot:scaffold272334_cov33-Tisochrysis_lutea.AAC.2
MVASPLFLASLSLSLVCPRLDVGGVVGARVGARVGAAVQMAAKGTGGKGFGKPKTNERQAPPAPAPAPESALPESAEREEDLAVARGQRALEAMRQKAGVDPDASKKARAAARRATYTEEEMTPLDPTAGVMPERVSNRMIARVIPFAGATHAGAAVHAKAHLHLRQLQLRYLVWSLSDDRAVVPYGFRAAGVRCLCSVRRSVLPQHTAGLRNSTASDCASHTGMHEYGAGTCSLSFARFSTPMISVITPPSIGNVRTLLCGNHVGGHVDLLGRRRGGLSTRY